MQIKRLQGDIEKRKGYYYEFDLDSKPIGHGGMGVVYHGLKIDEKTGVSVEVAIKALYDDLPEEVYARAEREASIQLRHDNLVEMLGLISEFEFNRYGSPVYHHYVISEFLHGIELSDLLVGRFSAEIEGENSYAKQLYNNYLKDREKTSVNIIRCILSGVLALHDKGYIHRDIDPSNIMVTSDGCIKLIDFGIAKNLQSLGSKDKLMTAAGKFIGKAEYASPELVLGDVHNQNYTTDVYALGILLYRLLVGRLPFEGSQYEVLQYQLKAKIPVKNIENVALAKVVKKATEKSQNHRYGTIAEFRVAIDTAANYKPGFIDSYWKYMVGTVGIAMCVGVMLWGEIGVDPDPGPKTLVEVKSQYIRFNEALALLNSDIADSVYIGFNQMKELAQENYDSAKVELGITYFACSSNEIELGSNLICQRRELLGLKNGDKYEMKNTISYLTGIKDTTCFVPEAYYILGCTYYNYSQDVNMAINAFYSARLLLDNKKKASHGYSTEDLNQRVQYNIEALKKVKNE